MSMVIPMCANTLPKYEPSKQYLFELMYNGVSLKKICELTGWSHTYINRKLKENDLPTFGEFKKTTLREIWKRRIAIQYMRLNGINSIASSTPLIWSSVIDVLHDMGIPTDLHLGTHLMKQRLETGWKPLSEHLQQAIEGQILSDGYLGLSNRASFFYRLINKNAIIEALENLQWFYWVDVEIDSLEKEISLFNNTRENLAYLQGGHFVLRMFPRAAKWVEYVADLFRDNGYYADIRTTYLIDKHGVKKPILHLLTEASLNLYIERSRWYGIVKNVPWDFELTPTSLLHWLMGDGSFNNEISFSTQNFHRDEVEFLAGQLRQKLGVKAKLDWRPGTVFGSSEPYKEEKRNPDRYWMIILPTDPVSRTRFLDYLNLAPGYEVAKKTMPWRFSKSIQKQDCV
ncbi:MAG: hypothetical protein ACFFBD_14115 [Candidatus Hodarchaeota archaeon]